MGFMILRAHACSNYYLVVHRSFSLTNHLTYEPFFKQI